MSASLALMVHNKHCTAGHVGISMRIPMEGLAVLSMRASLLLFPTELVLGTFVLPLRFQYGLNR